MAAPQSKQYANALKHIDDDVDWANDEIRATLHTSAYAPNQATDEFFSTIAGTEIASVSTTLAAAAAAGATSVSLTASIPVGNTVTIGTASNFESRVVTAIAGAGPFTATVAALTSAHASGEPAVAGSGYTTGGAQLGSKSRTVTGNVTAWKAGAVSWTPAANMSLGARWLVYRKNTGTAATSPLLAFLLLDSAPADVVAVGAPLTVTPDATTGVLSSTAA